MIRGYYLGRKEEAICALLTFRRKKKKVFQRELARKLGISQQAYQQKEKKCTFRLTEFLDVCEYLEEDPVELLKEAIQ
jgi:DNA-binding XRE family transcriptional regulator